MKGTQTEHPRPVNTTLNTQQRKYTRLETLLSLNSEPTSWTDHRNYSLRAWQVSSHIIWKEYKKGNESLAFLVFLSSFSPHSFSCGIRDLHIGVAEYLSLFAILRRISIAVGV
jgi:hypothetical protein